MASYNKSFASQISKFAEKAVNNIEESIRLPLFETFMKIINGWPVGDPNSWNITDAQRRAIIAAGYVGGRSRGDWRTSIGSPNLTATDGPPAQPRDVEDVYSEMKQMLDHVINSDGILFFSNNQYYANILEATGYSPQMSAGFVRNAALAMKGLIEREAIKRGK